MARRRALKAVAHNAAESFPNLANWSHDDTVLGHVILLSWRTGATRLNVNLLTGEIEPSRLASWSTLDSLARLVDEFPEFVARTGSDVSLIASAELSVVVDPAQRRPYLGYTESPFTCTVRLTDNKGRVHEHTRSGWRFPQASFRPKTLAVINIEQANREDDTPRVK